MTAYKITIRGDKYPTEYFVKASSWATAIARAVREWKKRFKGSKTTEMNIRAIKGGTILINTPEQEKQI